MFPNRWVMLLPSARAVRGVVLIFLLLVAGCAKKLSDPLVVELHSEIAVGEPDYVMTVQEFRAEFERNSKTAEEKYTGKVLEIAGTVLSTSRDDADRGMVLLGTGDRLEFWPVCTCLFQDRNIAEKVGKKQTVRVRGRYARNFAFRMLVGCVIVEKGPETLVHITAEQLAREYTADSEACEAQYKDRTLIVSGEISAVKTDENKVKFVELKGDGTTVIEVRHVDLGGKWPVDYKVGDKARMVADMLTIRNEKGLLVVIMDVALDGE